MQDGECVRKLRSLRLQGPPEGATEPLLPKPGARRER